MRRLTILLVLSLLTLGVLAAPAGAHRRDLGREVLAPDDGWAAADGGTTGGAAADAAHVFQVDTWQELRDALGGADARGDTTPRIVEVRGRLDANVTADGRRLTCADYADPGYTLAGYLAAYDPATWGDADPSGPLEEARARSQDNQEAQVRQFVGSNVTIVGVGRGAGIVGGNLMIRDADNVIVRNLHLSDAYDCFPAWDPGDGTWNSEYDNVSVWTSTHVWVDHNTFDDGAHPPSALPSYFGSRFEVHDGLLDITHGSDLVTVSWNEFLEHDKTMLIGSTNAPTYDVGRLRVTVHHNRFSDIGQRAPRVRYGQVHVANNLYVQRDVELYQYFWGVGVESRIYAEDNVFLLDPAIDPADIIREFDGTVIFERGSRVNRLWARTDLLAAYNAAYDPDLGGDVGWTPPHRPRLHPAPAVPALVLAGAGAGVLTRGAGT
jgi:pectate lyase